MSFRRKLLIVIAAALCVAVAAVAWSALAVTRRAFQRMDEERTSAFAAQFQREFTRRGEEIARKVEAIAATPDAARIAVDLNQNEDLNVYVNAAAQVAQEHQLGLLEFLAPDGTVISSAQWPARFNYQETPPAMAKEPFLRAEELPAGWTVGLLAVRELRIADKPLVIVGGQPLDREFLSSLALPAGTRVLLYRKLAPQFRAEGIVAADTTPPNPAKLAPLVNAVVSSGAAQDATIFWSADAAQSESMHAVPLKGADNDVLGVLLVASSRRALVESERHIRNLALLFGGAGILLAILLSGWAAARVTRPVEELAVAAREVAAGNWEARVNVASRDELGELADAFNRMTRELIEQRERLVQSERVAAWRELARRLAHELKNPLFPLQITVENLVRARAQAPAEFDDIFRESTHTLLAEIANLKAIVGRFSDFSKMPQPQLRSVNVNELVSGVAKLFEPQLEAAPKGKIALELRLDPAAGEIEADSELLHRAISNLVLNAIDAMPGPGTIRVETEARREGVAIRVSDTGAGLTPEEQARIFTPYYTSKQHGTGLGLAIVQSVVSDHGGKISVTSSPGRGATFIIELPRRAPERVAAARESR